MLDYRKNHENRKFDLKMSSCYGPKNFTFDCVILMYRQSNFSKT